MRKVLSGVLVVSMFLGLLVGSASNAAYAAAISCRSCPSLGSDDVVSIRSLSLSERVTNLERATAHLGFRVMLDELARQGRRVDLDSFTAYSAKNSQDIEILAFEFEGGVLAYGLDDDKSVVYLADRQELWAYNESGLVKAQLLDLIAPALHEMTMMPMGGQDCYNACTIAGIISCGALCAFLGVVAGMFCAWVCGLSAAGICECYCFGTNCPPPPGGGGSYPWD